MKQIVIVVILIFSVLFCNVSNRKKNLAMEKYKGYEKIINKDGVTPEIIPINKKMITINVPPNLEKSSIDMGGSFR